MGRKVFCKFSGSLPIDMVDLSSIKKMMALLAIGFCWAHQTGEWRAHNKPIRMCKHHDNLRPQNSYLRYGLDYIREIIINPFIQFIARLLLSLIHI